MNCTFSSPQSDEYSPYFNKYVSKVNGNLIDILQAQIDIYTDYIKENAHRMDYAYGPDKWTIRESLIHVIDTEQIFSYRALRISRGDKTPLAGYDQDEFIGNNDFSHISPWDILEEFTYQRRATISMLKKMTNSEIDKIGIASENHVSVRALAYIIAGHAEHHLELFKERYTV